MRISDWSSDVCSSDLHFLGSLQYQRAIPFIYADSRTVGHIATQDHVSERVLQIFLHGPLQWSRAINRIVAYEAEPCSCAIGQVQRDLAVLERSEEHTSELQSLMRISYAVFCLKKKIKKR